MELKFIVYFVHEIIITWQRRLRIKYQLPITALKLNVAAADLETLERGVKKHEI